MSSIDPALLPCPLDAIRHYQAYKVEQRPTIDGNLDKPCWQTAIKSPPFVDLVHNTPAIHDTRVSLLWDAENLYVAFWVEEPDVRAKFTERDSLIYEENDVELFIAGEDAYYEFEINALGTIYEVFFIWDDAWQRRSFDKLPEFDRNHPQVVPFDGVGFKHPRGGRHGYWNWDFPGLQSAVKVDGKINDRNVRDRGWTVELALPWSGLANLADGRSLPPTHGDIWRMDFSRFNQYKQAPPALDSSGWALSSHHVWDSHVPECFPFVHFLDVQSGCTD